MVIVILNYQILIDTQNQLSIVVHIRVFGQQRNQLTEECCCLVGIFTLPPHYLTSIIHGHNAYVSLNWTNNFNNVLETATKENAIILGLQILW